MKDPADEEIIRKLINHLREGGTLKSFENDSSANKSKVREVLIRVRNQYKAS
jgi:hypothetical protein